MDAAREQTNIHHHFCPDCGTVTGIGDNWRCDLNEDHDLNFCEPCLDRRSHA